MARVLLFGRLADVAGWRDRVIDSPSVAALRQFLTVEDARLGTALAAAGVQVAIDQAIVRGDRPLGPQAEVAFLPPMSGG
jgi:molybdopterin synthase sulfur carrier subunit